MINWITPQGLILEDYEKSFHIIDFKVDCENSAQIEKLSGNFPNGMELSKVEKNHYTLSGNLPIVNGETEYYFTLLATDKTTKETTQRYFKIVVKNIITDWDVETLNEYGFTETIYSKYQLLLKDSHGDEEFVKVRGELPSDIQLTSKGVLYGVVEEGKFGIYNFTVAVRRNNDIILERDFTINVKKLSDTLEPIWITEPGKIGNINYLEPCSLFIKGYDPNNLELTYIIINENNLPKGIKLNPKTGKLEGNCETLYNLDWQFDVKLNNKNTEIMRTFIISTNEVPSDEKVTWISDGLLSEGKIGYDYYHKLETKSKNKVSYAVIDGELPAGLSLSTDGIISGVVKYQDKKEYNFMIQATNGLSYIQKPFSINITKGLGQNAMKSYFYINNENLSEYQNMTELFNKDDIYNDNTKRYITNPKPEVQLCNCNTFDLILMRYMLSIFNTPLSFKWGLTEKFDYKENDDIKYSVFYKNIQEKYQKTEYWKTKKHSYTKSYVTIDIGYTYSGTNQTVNTNEKILEEIVDDKVVYYVLKDNEKIYVDKHITYYDELTGKKVTPTNTVWKQVNEGKEYIILNDEKIYVERLNKSRAFIKETRELIGINEKVYVKKEKIRDKINLITYVVRNNQEYEIEYASSFMLGDIRNNKVLDVTSENLKIFSDESIVRYYYDTSETFSELLTTTNGLREVLNEKIYVEKLNKEKVFYKKGNQEIIDIDDLEYREFIIEWDEERGTYYATHNGVSKMFQIYALDKNDPMATYQPVYTESMIIYDGGDSFNRPIFDRYSGGVANLTEADIINHIDANETYYEIKPVYFQTQYEDTDVDYQYYFVYEKGTFNEQDDILFNLSWRENSRYILQNGEFFKVDEISNPYIYRPENNTIGYDKTIVLPYVTDDDVIYDDYNEVFYIQFLDLDNEVLSEWKKDILSQNGLKYKPMLELFYSKPNTNIVALSEINENEKLGKYWTDRKHIFYELHFTPIFNNNIDNFTIVFYHHNNENSPHFQLI